MCCVALEECKFERVPDDMSVELDHITKGPLTTLDTENTPNMDRDQMRHTKSWQIGRLAIWHRTTHAALLREADKETLEVLPEDITASRAACPCVCSAIGSASPLLARSSLTDP